MKKAISAGTSAALLASLLATAVAPSAFASISTTSAGNVAQGSTSVGTATLVFTENSATALTAANVGTGQYMYVTITDHDGLSTVSWAGTPVLDRAGTSDSLSASVSIGSVVYAADTLRIHISNQDPATVEAIKITGLKVKALGGAAPGDVIATLTDTNGLLIANAFIASTAITGTLVTAVSTSATPGVQVSGVNASCAFTTASDVTFNTSGPDPRTPTFAGVVSGSQQVLDFPAGAASHLIGQTISQTVTCGLGAPATVVQAATYEVIGTNPNPTIFPGENNGRAADLRVTEPGHNFLVKGTTLTFTIATAGVVFSAIPDFDKTFGANGTVTGALSGDRKTLTLTVGANDATTGTAGVINVTGIHYDVASTVPGGTFVEVDLALSGGLLSDVSSNTNALVFRGITATAPTPTVYIGENNQATGLVTLVESGAGFFQAGPGPNNVIEVCERGVSYSYTFAPSAKVTTGDLLLRSGSASVPVGTAVTGTYNDGCYDWTVWAASTVASTIVIGNSTFTSGPLINVSVDQAPGIVAMAIYSGDSTTFTDHRIATVPFAVAMFRNQVVVTALTQPVIPAGAISKGGAIQIAETANGQLKAYEDICFQILPRTSNEMIQDTFLQNGDYLHTASLPVATATGGLIVGPVSMSQRACRLGGQRDATTGTGTNAVSFHFEVLQQSTAGNGKVVVDNINLIATADAPNGPVLFNVFGYGESNTDVDFQATVSNAKIGTAPKLNIAANSALGLNPTSGYNAKTPKTQAVGKYVTWKFTGGKSLAGQRVNVLVAKKFGGAWGGPVYYKSVWADANGIVTFAWTSKTAAAVNVRVQWPGTIAFAVSTSKALGAYYK